MLGVLFLESCSARSTRTTALADGGEKLRSLKLFEQNKNVGNKNRSEYVKKRCEKAVETRNENRENVVEP